MAAKYKAMGEVNLQQGSMQQETVSPWDSKLNSILRKLEVVYQGEFNPDTRITDPRYGIDLHVVDGKRENYCAAQKDWRCKVASQFR